MSGPAAGNGPVEAVERALLRGSVALQFISGAGALYRRPIERQASRHPLVSRAVYWAANGSRAGLWLRALRSDRARLRATMWQATLVTAVELVSTGVTRHPGHLWVENRADAAAAALAGILPVAFGPAEITAAAAVLAGAAAVAQVCNTRSLRGVREALPVALVYVTWAATSPVLMEHLRHSARDMARSQARAAAGAEARAAEEEHARLARLAHDHALQTLETIATEDFEHPRVTSLAAREAAYLRAALGGRHLGTLDTVVEEARFAGLQVTVEGPTVWDLPARSRDALVVAVREALRNTAKHSGTGEATLTCVPGPGYLTVTVTDRGRGFDLSATREGFGIPNSIVAVVEAAGGTADIRSAPGAGTRVTLTLPATPA